MAARSAAATEPGATMTMTKFLNAGLCFLLALAPLRAHGRECIAEADFGIAGFVLNQDEMRIRDKLLDAQSVEILTGENTRGDYYAKRYTYDKLLVEIVGNVVSRIYTESPDLPAPNGLRVGMNLEQARRVLGVERLHWNDNMREFHIGSCEHENGRIRVVVTVNANDRISAIEFISTNP